MELSKFKNEYFLAFQNLTMTNSEPSMNSQVIEDILEKITIAMDEKQRPKAKVNFWLIRIFYGLGVGCFLLALVLSLPFLRDSSIQFYGEYLELARTTTVSLLLVSYLIMLAYGLGFIALSFKDIKKYLVRPHEQIMKNVCMTAESELMHFQFLLTHEASNLRYVLRHLKSEAVFFESRASLIAGSVAKVGIFPALLAFFALVQKMSIPSNGFLQALVYAMPVLYFLSFYDVFIKAKMERHAALLELAISEIEEKEKKAELGKAKTDTEC